MAAADDVAAYILGCRGEMTTLKLHLLLYYAQAWSLVWDERPLFDEPIEARPHGPVVSSLPAGPGFPFKLSAWPEGDPAALTSTERETIDAVLDFYGSKNTPWLGELARQEQPWRAARAQVDAREPHPAISPAALVEYYSAPY